MKKVTFIVAGFSAVAFLVGIVSADAIGWARQKNTNFSQKVISEERQNNNQVKQTQSYRDNDGWCYDLDSVFLEEVQTELSETEKELLISGQQEERLARDVYLFLAEKYDLRVFSNIARSEDHHIDMIGMLLERYDIPESEGYGSYTDLYAQLTEQGSASLKDALEVGMTIEILDIDDLKKTMGETENTDIISVYEKLYQASTKHLSSFTSQFVKNGYETDIEWQEYISEDDLDTRGGGMGRMGGNHRGAQGDGGSGNGRMR